MAVQKQTVLTCCFCRITVCLTGLETVQFGAVLYPPLCMRVIFTVVLKSPFSSGLYPPLLYACHFYCGVEESISSGLYLLLLYTCHLYCGVEESIFK